MVQINYGADKNKLAVIVEIVDHNRALIDGPLTGVARQVLSFRRMNLTKFKCEVPRAARSKVVAKYFEQAQILTQWNATSQAKKLVKAEIRRNLTDFDRFKVMCAQKKVNLFIAYSLCRRLALSRLK